MKLKTSHLGWASSKIQCALTSLEFRRCQSVPRQAGPGSAQPQVMHQPFPSSKGGECFKEPPHCWKAESASGKMFLVIREAPWRLEHPGGCCPPREL